MYDGIGPQTRRSPWAASTSLTLVGTLFPPQITETDLYQACYSEFPLPNCTFQSSPNSQLITK